MDVAAAPPRRRSEALERTCTPSSVLDSVRGRPKRRVAVLSDRRNEGTRADGSSGCRTYRRVLSIAGSDAGGGAGVQADLKTIGACGCFGMTAITALTAQNTVGVQAIHEVPSRFVRQQIDSVLSDIGADVVKIGMLHSASIVRTVADALRAHRIDQVVVDPVMVTTSGDPLLQEEALQELKATLLPRALVITPNLPEAAMLLGVDTLHADEMQDGATQLGRTLETSVLLKGGHLSGTELVDVLYNHRTAQLTLYRSERVETPNTHGTGCTLSSALASFLAHGLALEEATQEARRYLVDAIRAGAGYHMGEGHGPVHHFGRQWT